MSESLVPAGRSSSAPVPHEEAAVAPWSSMSPAAPPPPPEEEGIAWTRYLAALRRYKWLVLGIVLAGTALGVLASQRIQPKYETDATIWITSEAPRRGATQTPFETAELLDPRAWTELLTSYAVLDPVVRERRLFIHRAPGDSALFAGFEPTESMVGGIYTLAVSGGRWVLSSESRGRVDEGAVGDSIGRPVGFRWAPTAAQLAGRELVEFGIAKPRNVARSLRGRLRAVIPEHASFIKITMEGTDPQETAATLNAIADQFVETAGDLKRRNLVELTRVLEEQLAIASDRLRDSERELENFRVRTITLPSQNMAVAPGLEATRDPVFGAFFEQKSEYDNIRHDRQLLEQLLADARAGRAEPGTALAIPSTVQAEGLRTALNQLAVKQAELRAARRFYTEEHQNVRTLAQEVETLRTREIPARVEELLDQLRRRENDLARRIAGASRELQGIPTRAIEEQRLARAVDVNEEIQTGLQQRFEAARLAEASVIPDISVLDPAPVPGAPTSNTAPRIVALAVIASIGFAVLLAILLDHLDRRLRYPEQVTRELGLDIIGAVPRVGRRASVGGDPEEAAQVVEAFRTIRLHLLNSHEGIGPLAVTISSPGAGEGKSLVSSNLALSFAEAGYRTLVVDGDLRRGDLHTVLNVARRPGLYDYLVGEATAAEVLRPSQLHENIAVIPCGTRRHRAPELLSSNRTAQLLAEVQREYDVVIVDSPPLSAGIDAFALATTTRNLVLVTRIGVTDRKLAAAKLRLVDRLPVRLLGAVLNDIDAKGAFEYYSYDYRYAVEEEDTPGTEVTTTGREVAVR